MPKELYVAWMNPPKTTLIFKVRNAWRWSMVICTIGASIFYCYKLNYTIGAAMMVSIFWDPTTQDEWWAHQCEYWRGFRRFYAGLAVQLFEKCAQRLRGLRDAVIR